MFQVVTPRLIIHINQINLYPFTHNKEIRVLIVHVKVVLIQFLQLDYFLGIVIPYNFYSFFYQFQDTSNSQSERIYRALQPLEKVYSHQNHNPIFTVRLLEECITHIPSVHSLIFFNFACKDIV